MLNQLEMSFEPLVMPNERPYRETSHEAMESIKETKEAHYEKLLRVYRDNPMGLTSEEAAFKAGISYESSHKRVADLVSMHKLYNSGIKRMNKSGRRAEVRKIVEQ